MIAALMIGVVIAGSQVDPIDFQLKWKKGQKMTYTVGVESTSPTGRGFEGEIHFTVTRADGDRFTISWPGFNATVFGGTFDGQAVPHPAGSVTVTKYGRVKKGDPFPGTQFVLLMLLPTKPVEVGEKFSASFEFPTHKYSYTGKLEKIDTANGRIAHFLYEGQLTLAGDVIDEVVRTTFDMDRGLVLRSEKTIEVIKGRQYLILKEPQKAVKDFLVGPSPQRSS